MNSHYIKGISSFYRDTISGADRIEVTRDQGAPPSLYIGTVLLPGESRMWGSTGGKRLYQTPTEQSGWRMQGEPAKPQTGTWVILVM